MSKIVCMDIQYNAKTKELFIGKKCVGHYSPEQASEKIRRHFLSKYAQLQTNKSLEASFMSLY